MDYVAMMEAFQQKRLEDGLAAYKRLSPSLQKEKAYMLLRISAAQQTNDEEYISAIDAFRAAYPDDACIDLVSVDSFIAKMDFESAHNAIERLNKSLGGDPYLHVVRASSYLSENKFDDADREAKAALEGDASLTSALWVLVSISLNKREFADTADLLTKIQRAHRVDLTNLALDASYADFVKSPEYKKWLAENPSTP